MKKLLTAVILGVTLLSSSSIAYAANNVSTLAVTNGGRSVAACARMMDQGISECVKATGCNMQP
jgi:hypothetical protein